MLFLAVFFLFLLLPIPVRLRAQTREQGVSVQAWLKLPVKALPLLRQKMTVSDLWHLLKQKDTKKRRLLRKMKDFFSIEKLKLSSRIGLADAGSTAMATAVAFGLVAPVAASVPRKAVQVDICPDYEKPAFTLDVDCTVKTNPGNLAVGLLFLLGGMCFGKTSH